VAVGVEYQSFHRCYDGAATIGGQRGERREGQGQGGRVGDGGGGGGGEEAGGTTGEGSGGGGAGESNASSRGVYDIA